MPFTQMILFPTELKLITTQDGLRMIATPIREVDLLHGKHQTWKALTTFNIDTALQKIAPGPLDVTLDATLPMDGALTLRYQDTDLVTLHRVDLPDGHGPIRLLIDKAVAEIFVDGGRRYIVRELPASKSPNRLGCRLEGAGTRINQLNVQNIKSMWKGGA